jgi:hypothetical protein
VCGVSDYANQPRTNDASAARSRALRACPQSQGLPTALPRRSCRAGNVPAARSLLTAGANVRIRDAESTIWWFRGFYAGFGRGGPHDRLEPKLPTLGHVGGWVVRGVAPDGARETPTLHRPGRARVSDGFSVIVNLKDFKSTEKTLALFARVRACQSVKNGPAGHYTLPMAHV